MAMRNIACLPALVGAFRDAAGGIMLSTSGNFAIDDRALSRPDLLAGSDTAHHQHVDHRPRARWTPRRRFARSSSTTPIRWRSLRIRRGWPRALRARILFTVVLEHFQTDTADYADIVLPATTQLEHLDVIKPYGHYYMVANNPAIRPLGEAKPNTEIFRLLAKAMGFTDPCFDDSDATIAQSAVAADWDFDAVRAQGWKRIGAPEGHRSIRRWRLRYPVGQGGVLFRSGPAAGARSASRLYRAARGHPQRARAALPAGDDLSAGAQFPQQQLRQCRRACAPSEGEPWLDIHPEDAAARGIHEGGYVRVFNDRGSLELRARVSDRARRGVVVALSVWWKKLSRDGKNANELDQR